MKITDKKLFRRAIEKTGLSGSALKRAAKRAGIRNFDSKNDLRSVVYFVKNNKEGKWEVPEEETAPKDTLRSDYDDLLKKYEAQQTSNTDLERRIGNLSNKIGGYDREITNYRSKIGKLEGKVADYDSRISDYQSRVSTLSNQYSSALKANQSLTTERDKARQEFADQSAAYQAAMQERDMYREMNVNQQLRSLRGGATAGGANQTSFRSGSLASGKTGYDSGARDRELAERVAQEGMTDSVLARETPVVELIDRRRQGSGQAPGQVRAMTTSGGSGSYYASRFGG